MESLSEVTWDLVIVGTSLPQALLALALSRSDLKILHVDKNAYYGGADAGLSLDEAHAWAQRHADSLGGSSSAAIIPSSDSRPRLAASRAYTLSLNPQIIYAQSTFLPSLVSSHTNTQLEFLAVGSWWLCQGGKIKKVPSSREDVFADDGLSRRDKIALMKLLRSVMQDGTEETDTHEPATQGSLHEILTSRYKISPTLQTPILSLALEQKAVRDAQFDSTMLKIQRHLQSMGYFGPGFGAVVSKYAGNAEIAQVACRACAVGGGTYLLGQNLDDVSSDTGKETAEVRLTGETSIKARKIVGGYQDLPIHLADKLQPRIVSSCQVCRSINVVSSALLHLFPQTSENGPTPAAAIILMGDENDPESILSIPPVYIQVHSEDTGECPQGQCLLYASTLHPEGTEPSTTSSRLASAVRKFLDAQPEAHTGSADTASVPDVLWSMSYFSTGLPTSTDSQVLFQKDTSGRILTFPPPVQDLAFNDSLLDSVKAVWKEVVGDTADDSTFMRLTERSQEQGEDDS